MDKSALVLAAFSAAALYVAAPSFAQVRTDAAVPGTPLPKVERSPCTVPVTPAVLALSVSVPAAGTQNACTNDTQCTGVGEACTVLPSATQGTCSASGHLVRDSIHYVAGRLVDVTVALPSCVYVTDVLLGGSSLNGGSNTFDSTSPASWSATSLGDTAVNGQPAFRQRVRIQFPNFGDGQSFPIQLRVSSYVGGASVLSAPFTLASVAAVNAVMHNTTSETGIRNELITSLYERFGDNEETFGFGYRLFAPSWQELTPTLGGLTFPGLLVPTELTHDLSGVYRFRGSDIRIGDGIVVVSTQFKVDTICTPDVYIDGWFTLAPAGDGIAVQWVVGPRAMLDASDSLCETVVEPSFPDVSDQIEQEFKDSLQKSLGADKTGYLKICDMCRVLDVKIGNGRIDIWTKTPGESVRILASADDLRDSTATPNLGLILPAGMYAPISGGASVESCGAVQGQGPSTCSPKFSADIEGLFNWQGNDIPVPDPDFCNSAYGCGTPGREHARARLLGVSRDVTTLPAKQFPVASLVARRTSKPSTKTQVDQPTTHARISNGCVIPPNMSAPYRVAFDVNDDATPPSGDPPSRGKFDVHLVIAQSAAVSANFFSSREQCMGVSSAPVIVAAP